MEQAQKEKEQDRSQFAAPTNWQLDYEERAGFGNYQDRRSELRTIINKYDQTGRADLEAVYHDLAEARKNCVAIFREGEGTTWTRQQNESLQQVADFITSLRRGLRLAQRTFTEIEYTELGNGRKPKLVTVVNDLLARIERSDREPDPDDPTRQSRFEADLLLVQKFPGATRRRNRGNPKAAITGVINAARKRLLKHGITHCDDRRNLLYAIGLLVSESKS
jgi:hypothetical protein